MNRPTRTLAALTGVAALTVAGMSPASAAFWAHDDAIGDVVSYTESDGGDTLSGPDPRPGNTNADVTRFTANHTARRVVLRTTLRDINAGSGAMMYEFRTGTRRYFAEQRLGKRRDLGPAFDFFRVDGGTSGRCFGVRRRIDRTTEQVMVSIPRRCLARPRWVRVSAAAWTYRAPRTTFTYFVDDALKDDPGDPVFDFARSPRIERG